MHMCVHMCKTPSAKGGDLDKTEKVKMLILKPYILNMELFGNSFSREAKRTCAAGGVHIYMRECIRASICTNGGLQEFLWFSI